LAEEPGPRLSSHPLGYESFPGSAQHRVLRADDRRATRRL